MLIKCENTSEILIATKIFTKNKEIITIDGYEIDTHILQDSCNDTNDCDDMVIL